MMKTLWARLAFLYSHTRGRTARPASVGFNLFKTMVQSVAIWALFLGLGPWIIWHGETILMRAFGLWRLESATGHIVGTLLFVLGWSLAWTSASWMVVRGDGTPLPLDCPNQLVIAGPYRWVRNPMALGSLTQGLGIACWFASPLMALYVVCGGVLWNLMARPWEERDLESRFGAPFRHYQSHVRCWIPRLKPYSIPR